MFKRYLIYLVFNGLTLTVSLITLPVITRFLNPSEFGLASLVISISAFFLPLISCGSDSLLPVVQSKGETDRLLKMRSAAYSFSILLTAAAILLVVPFTLIQWVSPIIFLAPLLSLTRALRSAQQSGLIYQQQVWSLGISNLGLAILSLAFTWIILFFYATAEARIICLISAEFLVLFFLLKGSAPWIQFSRSEIRQLLRHGVPLALATLPSWLINDFGKFYLAATLSLNDVGVLSLAFSLGLVYMQLSASIINALSRSFYDNPQLAFSSKFHIKIFASMALTATGCSMGIMLIGPTVFDERYLNAFDSVNLILIGYFFQSLTMISNLYFNCFKLTHLRLYAIGIASLLNILFLTLPFTYFIAPITRVALAFSLSMLLYSTICFAFMWSSRNAQKTVS